MSELYDIEELPEGNFPLSFKLIGRYQRKDPIPTKKITRAEYKKGYFRGSRNTIKSVTFKDKIVIMQLIQKYVVRWHHSYLLHTVLDRTEAMLCQYFY